MDTGNNKPVSGLKQDVSPPLDEDKANNLDLTEEDDLRQKLEEMTERANQNWDKLVRAQAEVENIRKRSVRDMEQAKTYSIEKFVLEMLAVKDSLELGLSKVDKKEVDKLHEGVLLTLKLFKQVFDKFEIEEISPRGEQFDPERHQAMMTQPDDKHEAGTVLQVMQKGYLLSGRLIRPALVNVAGNAPAKDEESI